MPGKETWTEQISLHGSFVNNFPCRRTANSHPCQSNCVREPEIQTTFREKTVPRPAKKDGLAKIENYGLPLFSLSSPRYYENYLSPRSCGRPVHCSTVQYSTVQYSTVQYSTVQYSTVQCSVTGGKYFTLPLQRKTLTNLSQCDRALIENTV